MRSNDNVKMDFDAQGYQEKFEIEFDKQQTEFEELKKTKLILSLVGTVNVGKSSTINALFGKKLSSVNGAAGWTKEIKVFNLTEQVIIADTPGLHDINEDVARKADEFIEKNTDIIFFFLNAAVGITIQDKKAIDFYKSLNRPLILVLNKVDIWYEGGILSEKEAYLQTVNQIHDMTGLYPLPISAAKGIGIKELHLEILRIVETLGKEILYAKPSIFKEEMVKKWINGATAVAAGIGVIPVPGADIVPLTALQVGLALKIAYIYDCEVSKDDVMTLIASTITGRIGKQLFRYGITAMKGLGWLGGPFGAGVVAVLAASIAAATTYAFGHACKAYYKSGMQIDLGELGIIFEKAYEQYKSQNEDFAFAKDVAATKS